MHILRFSSSLSCTYVKISVAFIKVVKCIVFITIDERRAAFHRLNVYYAEHRKMIDRSVSDTGF